MNDRAGTWRKKKNALGASKTPKYESVRSGRRTVSSLPVVWIRRQIRFVRVEIERKSYFL